ncbi:nitroreductase family protein [Paenibacillus pinistramenti]|uniref:nitroreductase family protein n=1 Tax=Paenibacillus pinistramenti TaxID=1768003 RepID=UPI001109ADA2|nr:nitroreductase family protein [Paenibacillus pinistramenti]
MSKPLQAAQEFAAVLKERRSVRHYDPTVKISREEIKQMFELALTAPSSSNMQPWRFLIIDDQGLKEKLLPISYNQQHVLEASAVIAVLIDMKFYEKASEIYHSTANLGVMSEELRDKMIQSSLKLYGSLPEEALRRVGTFDAGLVSMQLMLAARSMGYDTVPMGGYNAEQFKAAFDVPATYEPALLIAVGKASEAGHPTSRLTFEEVTNWNSFN